LRVLAHDLAEFFNRSFGALPRRAMTNVARLPASEVERQHEVLADSLESSQFFATGSLFLRAPVHAPHETENVANGLHGQRFVATREQASRSARLSTGVTW
jgi:hypothetical protein